MPVMKLPDGGSAFICERGRRKPKACQFCGCGSELLCDGMVRGRKFGGKKFCSAPMCRSCAKTINGKDFCTSCVNVQLEQLFLDLPRPPR